MIIPTGTPIQPIINAGGAVCRAITISIGGTLTINGNNTLSVFGDWTNNGTGKWTYTGVPRLFYIYSRVKQTSSTNGFTCRLYL